MRRSSHWLNGTGAIIASSPSPCTPKAMSTTAADQVSNDSKKTRAEHLSSPFDTNAIFPREPRIRNSRPALPFANLQVQPSNDLWNSVGMRGDSLGDITLLR